LKAHFEGIILNDDSKPVSIFGVDVNLIDRLALKNIEHISSNESHELRKEDGEFMISN
jgi:hypothetical protein